MRDVAFKREGLAVFLDGAFLARLAIFPVARAAPAVLERQNCQESSARLPERSPPATRGLERS